MDTPRYGLDTPLAPQPPRPRSARRLIALASIAALAAAGGGIWASAASPAGPRGYRTTTVTREAVQQAISQSGTIEPVAQAAISFPTAGIVAAVDVNVGDTVTPGQTLATLDTTTLHANVLKADATLANAQLALQRALDGDPTTGSTTGGSEGSAAVSPSGEDVHGEVASSDQPAAIVGASSSTEGPQAAQHAVLTAQQAVDARLATAQSAVAAATEACSSDATTTSSPSSTSPSTTTTTSPSPSRTKPSSGGSSPSAACSQALASALAAEQALAGAQQSLAAAAAKLTADLASSTSGRDTTTAGSGAGTDDSLASSSRTQRSSGSNVAAPSAADLIADQAAVDASRLAVAAAQQAVAQATIVSPISGDVVEVPLSPGQHVTAGSATAAIVVVSRDTGYEVATTVTVDQLTHLAVGASAAVHPDGSATTLGAKVVHIGVDPVATATTTVYPVVLGITDPSAALRNGSGASVTIVLDATPAALAVPTSAVQSVGGRKLVTVLRAGKAVPTVVTTGSVGDKYTAITSGLSLGQTVVLADLSEPLPAADADTSSLTGLQNGGSTAFRRGSFGGAPSGGGGVARGG